MEGEDKHPKEFPDVTQKLSAPKKLSAYEKERQAQEEKRRREQAEAAAALKEFEESFGQDEDSDDGFPPNMRGPPGGPRGPGSGYGPPRGGFGGPPRSGPGSLGPPPPNLKRKRALDEIREQQEARREQAAFDAEYNGRQSRHEDRYYDDRRDRDEEPEDIAPRPTVKLSSLPPTTTERDVKALLREHLPVYNVFLELPPGSTSRSLTAIATLEHETSTSQIDNAVSALRDKYLGRGYRLSIARHLSSTALHPSASTGPAPNPEPFGAEKINRDQPRGYSMRNAPPPPHFAPPDAYDYDRQSRAPGSDATATLVVQPPTDIATLRAIHVLVDRLLSEPNPSRVLEIEAVLMDMPEVESDERFSFLYDSQSPAGVYYRYLLSTDADDFEVLQEQKRLARGPERVYQDVAIDWNVSQGEVPFADLSSLGAVLDHPNYESSEEDSDDGEPERKFNQGRREGEGAPTQSEKKHLTPLQVAKFCWLLSRMPSSQARLRKGDVAAVTSFAINTAGVGAEEVVDLLVLNVERPFNTTQCANFDAEDVTQDDEDMYEPDEQLPSIEAPSSEGFAREKKESEVDPSQAKLVALFLINDVLHNSSTAGVRNAWKYRQLFEVAFQTQQTFKHLGHLAKNLGWGRMKEEQWRNKIRFLIESWESNSIFSGDVFEILRRDFFEQPVENDVKLDSEKPPDVKYLAKFKRIDGSNGPSASASPAPVSEFDGAPLDLDGAPLDLDGAPLDLDGNSLDLDGAPLDLSGAPMDDESMKNNLTEASRDASGGLDSTPMDLDVAHSKDPSIVKSNGKAFSLKASGDSKPAAPQTMRKKQAEDMFADSDEE